MQCRTCGEHGKEGLSSLDPEQASLLPQLAACSSFVCHDCVVEIQHWRHFLTRFQTSQTLFQKVLKSKQHLVSLQQTDVAVPLKLAECRVLVPKLLECEMCSFYTNNKSQLSSHRQAHQSAELKNTIEPTVKKSSVNKFICSHCDRKFPSKTQILKHVKQRHLKFKCNQCKFKFWKKENLKFHVTNVHEKIIPVKCLKNEKGLLLFYQCTLCTFHSKLRVKVESHYRMNHSKDRPFVCEICSKGFCNQFHLRNHMTAHKKPKLECSSCQKKFKWKYGLTLHIRYVHNKYPKPRRCEKRPKSGAIYQCEKCPSKFNRKTNLNAHKIIVHSNIKYKCEICNISIKSARYLGVHMRLKHSTEQKFECKMCKRRFSFQWVLNKHNKEQHPETPDSAKFECNECGAVFIRKSTLEHHFEDLHLFKGSNILHCKYCLAKYRNQARFKRHMKKKHFHRENP